MGLAFSGLDIIRFGIFVYVATWLGFFCYVNIYSRRKNQNVHKVARCYSITVAIRYCGWLGGLIASLILIWILPDVYVITQNPDRKRAEIEEDNKTWHWRDTTYTTKETFYVDRYYVPFLYRGRRCNAFNSYLINESDSTLVLYSTNLFNGMFTGVSDVSEFEIIPPNHFQEFDRFIDNKFDSPSESSFSYTPKERKNKSTTEVSITLMSDAIYETEEIRERIRHHNEIIFGRDSLGNPLTPRELVLRQLKKQQDVKQGTH